METLLPILWPTPLGPVGPVLAAVVLLSSAAFLLWLVAYPLSAEAWRARLGGGLEAAAKSVVLERISGGLILGLGAALVWRTALPHLAVPAIRPATSAAWLLIASLVVLPIVALSARKPAMQERYPEIRQRVSSKQLAIRSLISTAVYLLGYELFFRGLLTFGLVDLLGVWPGLSAMTAVYVVAHLRKDASETVACLPMGYVFGVMALQTGSILTPWLLHVALAWTNEWITARANPDMDYPL